MTGPFLGSGKSNLVRRIKERIIKEIQIIFLEMAYRYRERRKEINERQIHIIIIKKRKKKKKGK